MKGMTKFTCFPATFSVNFTQQILHLYEIVLMQLTLKIILRLVSGYCLFIHAYFSRSSLMTFPRYIDVTPRASRGAPSSFFFLSLIFFTRATDSPKTEERLQVVYSFRYKGICTLKTEREIKLQTRLS